MPFDALDPGSHQEVFDAAVRLVGDLDVVISGFGVLGSQAAYDADPAAAMTAVAVNYGAHVSVGLHAARVLRAQGHGTLVVLSSVAGARVRRANFVYGSAKAGLDGFAQGLGDALHGSGARVLIVRPGFVIGRMTEGLTPAPLSSTPRQVAVATVRALRDGIGPRPRCGCRARSGRRSACCGCCRGPSGAGCHVRTRSIERTD